MNHTKETTQYHGGVEEQILTVDKELEATERAIQVDFAHFVENPDSHQKKILVELGRLHLSLRGPETLVDMGSYSRLIAPPFQQQKLKKGGQ